jgi:hypothetical protein
MDLTVPQIAGLCALAAAAYLLFDMWKFRRQKAKATMTLADNVLVSAEEMQVVAGTPLDRQHADELVIVDESHTHEDAKAFGDDITKLQVVSPTADTSKVSATSNLKMSPDESVLVPFVDLLAMWSGARHGEPPPHLTGANAYRNMMQECMDGLASAITDSRDLIEELKDE